MAVKKIWHVYINAMISHLFVFCLPVYPFIYLLSTCRSLRLYRAYFLRDTFMILHQPDGSVSCYGKDSTHPRWCKISFINSVSVLGL